MGLSESTSLEDPNPDKPVHKSSVEYKQRLQSMEQKWNNEKMEKQKYQNTVRQLEIKNQQQTNQLNQTISQKQREINTQKQRNNRLNNDYNKSKLQIQQLQQETEQKMEHLKGVKFKPTINTKIEYPAWFDKSQLHTVYSYAKPLLKTLDLNKSPGKDVVDNFKKTVRNKKVIKVEGVQNQMLYDDYYNAKIKLTKLIGENKLNERDVFHGTRSMDIMKFVYTEGFRKEFNKSAAVGKGTYFARDASYSASSYAAKHKGLLCIFQCKVIMGEWYKGDSKYQLTTWPKKSNGLIYDSLVNNTNNPSVFVIHDNVRAYPMFIIHFK